jgi:hypothetical protein
MSRFSMQSSSRLLMRPVPDLASSVPVSAAAAESSVSIRILHWKDRCFGGNPQFNSNAETLAKFIK